MALEKDTWNIHILLEYSNSWLSYLVRSSAAVHVWTTWKICEILLSTEDKSDKQLQPASKRQRVTTDDEYNDHRNDPQIAFCLDCIK